MRAYRLRASNYKSLGESKNELRIASGITVIIGKNQSGKTNLLDAFGELDFSKRTFRIENADKKLNRMSGGGDITITLTLRKDENRTNYTQIIARKNELVLSGHLVEQFRADKGIKDCIAKLARNPKAKHLVHNFYFRFASNPYVLCREIKKLARQTSVAKSLFSYVEEYISELPYLLFVNNDGKNSFKDYYFLDEIPRLNSDDIFSKLLAAAGIANVFKPSGKGLLDGESLNSPLSRQIIASGLEKVAGAFGLFSGEGFKLGLEITESRVQLTTEIDGKKALFDELEVCKKWFFALFVDLISRQIKNKTILFVFDQPGLYMHVNAQKELLKVFKQIAASGHQIIYTTHSPYLLDISELASIRAVEKHRGQSYIYNKIYAAENASGAKLETLTPIFEALGVGFSPDLSFLKSRMNLIVEGISDYYYLKAMLGYYYEDESAPYILPAVGATNIGNVASILIGWGQPFRAIVDYDEEGKKAAEKMESRLGLALGEDIFYINGKTDYRGESVCRIEEMLDVEDRRKLLGAAEKQTKALLSREFYDQIKQGKLVPSQKTRQNFQRLFSALKASINPAAKKN